MVNQQVLKQIGNLENELQRLKLAYIVPGNISIYPSKKKGTVEATAGLLGKKFPSGIIFESNIRKEWKRRIAKLGL